MRLRKRYADTLTRGEQAILDLLVRQSRMTGPQIANALHSTPASIKVMVCRMRKKGITIKSGGIGQSSIGYRLDGLA